MASATPRRTQPAKEWGELSAHVPLEELTLLETWHPNVLIAGPAEATVAALDALHAAMRPPIINWYAGSPFAMPPGGPARTLMLHDVAALSATEQQRLHQWLQQHDSAMQVVATTSRPLLPLVEQGQFDAALYYTLNVIYLDVFSEAPLSR
jgi:hypothetical protein